MARKAPRTITLAYLRWFDSALYKGESYQPEELSGPCELESAGLLVGETKEAVTIAVDRSLENGNLRLVLCVPRANIRVFRKAKIGRGVKVGKGAGRHSRG